MCASTCGVPPFLCLKTRVLSCHYNSLIISFDFGLCYKEGEGSLTDIIGQPLTDQHDTFRITLSDVTTNFPHRWSVLLVKIFVDKLIVFKKPPFQLFEVNFIDPLGKWWLTYDAWMSMLFTEDIRVYQRILVCLPISIRGDSSFTNGRKNKCRCFKYVRSV